MQSVRERRLEEDSRYSLPGVRAGPRCHGRSFPLKILAIQSSSIFKLSSNAASLHRCTKDASIKQLRKPSAFAPLEALRLRCVYVEMYTCCRMIKGVGDPVFLTPLKLCLLCFVSRTLRGPHCTVGRRKSVRSLIA